MKKWRPSDYQDNCFRLRSHHSMYGLSSELARGSILTDVPHLAVKDTLLATNVNESASVVGGSFVVTAGSCLARHRQSSVHKATRDCVLVTHTRCPCRIPGIATIRSMQCLAREPFPGERKKHEWKHNRLGKGSSLCSRRHSIHNLLEKMLREP